MNASIAPHPARILFAQMREDPAVDARALDVKPGDRVLAITSGGCTALTLLAREPAELCIVDANPAQNHLFELKLAALRRLEHPDALRLMGARPSGRRWELYQSLASELSEEARAFWNARRGLLEKGLLYTGITERRVRWLANLLFLLQEPCVIRKCFLQTDLAKQRDFYDGTWSNWKWRLCLETAFNRRLLKWTYGRRWFNRFPDSDGDVAATIRRKIERGFLDFPIRHNYFLSQLILGKYPPGSRDLPPYLLPDVQEKIRSFRGRLRIITSDFLAFAASSAPGSFDRMTLSNAFEWFREPELKEAFGAVSKLLSPGGRACLRHMLGVAACPSGMGITEDQSLSDRLTKDERALLYDRVSVYSRN